MFRLIPAKVSLPIGTGMLLFGQAVPDASVWIQGGGVAVLGYLCWTLIQRDERRDNLLGGIAIALTELRDHCATRNAPPPAPPPPPHA